MIARQPLLALSNQLKQNFGEKQSEFIYFSLISEKQIKFEFIQNASFHSPQVSTIQAVAVCCNSSLMFLRIPFTFSYTPDPFNTFLLLQSTSSVTLNLFFSSINLSKGISVLFANCSSLILRNSMMVFTSIDSLILTRS